MGPIITIRNESEIEVEIEIEVAVGGPDYIALLSK